MAAQGFGSFDAIVAFQEVQYEADKSAGLAYAAHGASSAAGEAACGPAPAPLDRIFPKQAETTGVIDEDALRSYAEKLCQTAGIVNM